MSKRSVVDSMPATTGNGSKDDLKLAFDRLSVVLAEKRGHLVTYTPKQGVQIRVLDENPWEHLMYLRLFKMLVCSKDVKY